MKRIGIVGVGISVIFVAILAGAIFGADSDPNAALKLYDGKWDVEVSFQKGRQTSWKIAAREQRYFLPASKS